MKRSSGYNGRSKLWLPTERIAGPWLSTMKKERIGKRIPLYSNITASTGNEQDIAHICKISITIICISGCKKFCPTQFAIFLSLIFSFIQEATFSCHFIKSYISFALNFIKFIFVCWVFVCSR